MLAERFLAGRAQEAGQDVDPEANTVELYRLQEDPHASARRLGTADTLSSDLFPGFSVPLADVFAP